jgi:hypothetical protein
MGKAGTQQYEALYIVKANGFRCQILRYKESQFSLGLCELINAFFPDRFPERRI